jgi:hypothetical protein
MVAGIADALRRQLGDSGLISRQERTAGIADGSETILVRDTLDQRSSPSVTQDCCELDK